MEGDLLNRPVKYTKPKYSEIKKHMNTWTYNKRTIEISTKLSNK